MVTQNSWGVEVMEENPYLPLVVTTIKKYLVYNPRYGDNRICRCGHPYHRHFDGFEEPEHQAVGCKYCPCYTFMEKV